MQKDRKAYLVRRACRQLIDCLEGDLKGGEFLMKEFWEECDDEDETEVGDRVLISTIEFLKGVVDV